MTNFQASLHAIEQRVRTLLECTTVTLSLAYSSKTCHPLLPLCPCREKTENIARLMCDENIQSSTVLPLARPAGLLGFLLCVDTQPNRFLQGEHFLLEQIAPMLACELEDVLYTVVTEVSQAARDSQAHVVSPVQQSLVSLVGHDLRMPLTAIKGYTSLLQTYGPTHEDMTPEQQQHYLDIIMEQTQHMEVLVNDLLDVSRVQNGQRALHYTWVNIVFLCQRVISMVQDRCEQQQRGKYTFRCRFDTTVHLLWADEDRVRQVLMNLVDNAVKYSPDGGLIEVRVRSAATLSSITVRDWGLGIPHVQPNTPFGAFQQGERLEQHTTAGLGLGLYIARTLVEAMGGTITLRSSSGNGTRVSFTLPNVYNVHNEHKSSQNLQNSLTLAENCPVCYSEHDRFVHQVRKCL